MSSRTEPDFKGVIPCQVWGSLIKGVASRQRKRAAVASEERGMRVCQAGGGIKVSGLRAGAGGTGIALMRANAAAWCGLSSISRAAGVREEGVGTARRFS